MCMKKCHLLLSAQCFVLAMLDWLSLRLRQISDVEGTLVRTFLSPAHMRAASMVGRILRHYWPSLFKLDVMLAFRRDVQKVASSVDLWSARIRCCQIGGRGAG